MSIVEWTFGGGALTRSAEAWRTVLLAGAVVLAAIHTSVPPSVAAQAESVLAPAQVPDSSMQAPTDIQLRVGETATLDGGALQVTLVQVVEDSRCPMNAMCVWMGRAVVSLHVTVDGVDRGDATATLSPGPMTERSPDLDARSTATPSPCWTSSRTRGPASRSRWSSAPRRSTSGRKRSARRGAAGTTSRLRACYRLSLAAHPG